MQRLTIRTQCRCNTTVIENEFIDTYMPKANGEYVKVYLYLLRHLNAQDVCITLTHMADCLDNTERDILRALKYWEREGLLIMSYDDRGSICGIDIATISIQNVGSATNTQIPAPTVVSATSKSLDSARTTARILEPNFGQAKPANIDSKEKTATKKATSGKSRKEFKQLLFMAEQYLGKTLSKSDVDTITYFYDGLAFSIPLIEFLIEYCAGNGHYSMHYIQTVALAWSNADISTVDAAKAQISNYNKNYYAIFKAYGLSKRNPVEVEKQFMDKWLNEYCFSMELIAEACSRTIAHTHDANFKYTDSILKNWLAQKVHYLADLEKLDQDHSSTKKKPVVDRTSPRNSFNNFQQRSYDISALEKQLLNVK